MSSTASGTSRKWEFSVDKSDDGSVGMMQPAELLCQLFESETGDWEMVASDGHVYKFHQFVLNEQVNRFRAIFAHPGTKEHVKKQVVVPPEVEMSGPAVEAFLRYVYYEYTVPLYSSCKITCALIRAGHYYDLPGLVDAATHPLYLKRMIDKKLSGFNFKDLWKLYQYVLLWEESHPFKENLIKELKLIIKMYCDACSVTDFTKLARILPQTILRDLAEAFVDVESSSLRSQFTTFNCKNILSPVALLRKLFENQDGDWKMIGSDGQAHKFHEAVLKEQVTSFRTIFAFSKATPSAEKQIVVPPEVGLTGQAVKAFLGYFYCHHTVHMNTSFGVTCALIRAGHYYNVPNMVDAATDVFYLKGVIDKEWDWYNFPDLWTLLYQQVWLWEEGHPFKKKLMESLHTIIKEFCNGKDAPKPSGYIMIDSRPLFDVMAKLAQEKPAPPPPIVQLATPNPAPRRIGWGRKKDRTRRR